MVHGRMVYTEHVPKWRQFHFTPLFRMCSKKQVTLSNDTCQEHSESVQDQRTALYKSDQQEEMKTAVSKCG